MASSIEAKGRQYCKRRYGQDTPLCAIGSRQELLSGGKWVPRSHSRTSKNQNEDDDGWRFAEYVPYSCCYHVFSVNETARCLSGKKIALLGDSQMRRIWRCIKKFASGDDKKYGHECWGYLKEHSDISWTTRNLFGGTAHVDFIWASHISSLWGDVDRLAQIVRDYDLVLLTFGTTSISDLMILLAYACTSSSSSLSPSPLNLPMAL